MTLNILSKIVYCLFILCILLVNINSTQSIRLCVLYKSDNIAYIINSDTIESLPLKFSALHNNNFNINSIIIGVYELYWVPKYGV